MPMTEPLRLRLLGRPECGLCEALEAQLHAHPGFAGVRLQLEDVDSHPEWQRRYGLRIPVLLDDWDEVVCEAHFDAVAFEAWLAEARRSRGAGHPGL
jgi:hypothetical protein